MPRAVSRESEHHRKVLSWNYSFDSSLGVAGLERKIEDTNELPGSSPEWPELSVWLPPDRLWFFEPQRVGIRTRIGLPGEKKPWYENGRTRYRSMAECLGLLVRFVTRRRRAEPPKVTMYELFPFREWYTTFCTSFPIATPWPLRGEDRSDIHLHVEEPLLGLFREGEARCIGPVKKRPEPEDMYADITVYMVGVLHVER